MLLLTLLSLSCFASSSHGAIYNEVNSRLVGQLNDAGLQYLLRITAFNAETCLVNRQGTLFAGVSESVKAVSKGYDEVSNIAFESRPQVWNVAKAAFVDGGVQVSLDNVVLKVRMDYAHCAHFMWCWWATGTAHITQTINSASIVVQLSSTADGARFIVTPGQSCAINMGPRTVTTDSYNIISSLGSIFVNAADKINQGLQRLTGDWMCSELVKSNAFNAISAAAQNLVHGYTPLPGVPAIGVDLRIEGMLWQTPAPIASRSVLVTSPATVYVDGRPIPMRPLTTAMPILENGHMAKVMLSQAPVSELAQALYEVIFLRDGPEKVFTIADDVSKFICNGCALSGRLSPKGSPADVQLTLHQDQVIRVNPIKACVTLFNSNPDADYLKTKTETAATAWNNVTAEASTEAPADGNATASVTSEAGTSTGAQNQTESVLSRQRRDITHDNVGSVCGATSISVVVDVVVEGNQLGINVRDLSMTFEQVEFTTALDGWNGTGQVDLGQLLTNALQPQLQQSEEWRKLKEFAKIRFPVPSVFQILQPGVIYQDGYLVLGANLQYGNYDLAGGWNVNDPKYNVICPAA